MKKTLCLTALMASLISITACTHTPTQQDKKPSNTVIKDSLDQRFIKHLGEMEKIAAQYDGNRAVGTGGGQATATYIIAEVKKAGLTAQMIPFENRNKVVAQNIIVELKGKNPNKAMIIGAHYDSVKMGPGINDNGTGVAVLLELIQFYANQKIAPEQTIYFAFWDSEEDGIGGSQHFVSKMNEAQLKAITAYINIDMVGTKNPRILIADADKSSLMDMQAQFKATGLPEENYQPIIDSLKSLPSHSGDTALENHLKRFFQARNLEIKEDISTLTASDTVAFLGKVPVTSIILFNEQERAGENKSETILDFAPCYHQACDTSAHVDPKSMVLAYDAIQHLLSVVQKQ